MTLENLFNNILTFQKCARPKSTTGNKLDLRAYDLATEIIFHNTDRDKEPKERRGVEKIISNSFKKEYFPENKTLIRLVEILKEKGVEIGVDYLKPEWRKARDEFIRFLNKNEVYPKQEDAIFRLAIKEGWVEDPLKKDE
ncbi:MAG: hypothetical protein OEX08_03540 [Candidatus Nomurabacteria bacterium]|nr:hypothetical protein [Candidatus Nomurabacteria bacterium]